MNNIFKHNKMIQLDEHYTLSTDGFNGVVLTFSEPRTRKKTDKDTRKETGETEQYIFEQQYYFPRVNQALNKFVELSHSDFKDLEDLKNKVDKTFAIIEEFNKKFKQF